MIYSNNRKGLLYCVREKKICGHLLSADVTVSTLAETSLLAVFGHPLNKRMFAITSRGGQHVTDLAQNLKNETSIAKSSSLKIIDL